MSAVQCDPLDRRNDSEIGSNEKEALFTADEQSDQQETDKSLWHICGYACDADLVKYKLFFFLFFGGFGSTFPYLGLYFKQIGLNAQYVGILAGVRPLIQFVSGPFWAVLADRYRCRKSILLFSILAWLVMTLLLAFPRPHNTVCKIRNGTNLAGDHVINKVTNVSGSKKNIIPDYVLPFQPRIGEFLYSQPCSGPSCKDMKKKSPIVKRHTPIDYDKEIFDEKLNVSYVIQRDHRELFNIFIILFILIVSGEFLEAPSFIMTDTALLEHLGEQRRQYGKTRLFGSLGYGLASFCIGAFLDTTKYSYCGRTKTNYIVLFYFFSGFMGIAFFFGLFFIKFKYQESKKAGNLREVLYMFANLKYGTFLAVSWSMGFFHGGIMNFLNWYLEDLGATKLMMGIATAFRCLSIVSGFFTSAYFIDKVGHIPIIYFAFFSYFWSFFAYSFIPSPWWAIPIECAQGVTYSMSWSACITYLGEVSPPNAQATVQGILQGVYWGLGTGLGAMVGGILINRFGVIWSFRAGGFMSLAIFLMFLALQIYIEKMDKDPFHHKKIEDEDVDEEIE